MMLRIANYLLLIMGFLSCSQMVYQREYGICRYHKYETVTEELRLYKSDSTYCMYDKYDTICGDFERNHNSIILSNRVDTINLIKEKNELISKDKYSIPWNRVYLPY